MKKLRVGIVDYLNSRPLAWGFHRGCYADRAVASFHPPAVVADRLAAGELDVGLIPAVEVQRIPGLRVIPGLCIGAVHEVRSVLLVTDRPLERVRRVALDRSSRTSAALVEILLDGLYGIRPEVTPAAADVEAMLATADAALIIGDPALRVDRARHQIVDLAAAWRRLTGLPAVFAVWAVHPSVAPQPLTALFEDSLALGMAELATIEAEAVASVGISPAEAHAYFTANLSYRLGPEERASLGEYWRRAHRLGLIPPPHPLTLWSEGGEAPSTAPEPSTTAASVETPAG